MCTLSTTSVPVKETMSNSLPPTIRETYRHGDLRQALVSAGIRMAAEGGPDAVILREATRQAGVSPNAAYRHFADRQALLEAVSAAAQGIVADKMHTAREAVSADDDEVIAAFARLRAVGRAYISFAQEQPGLFRAAFTVPEDLTHSGSALKSGECGFTPFQVLSTTLDELAATGALPPDRRANAELLAWSSVHGLGMLLIDGPLRGLTDEIIEHTAQRLLDLVERGL